MVQGEGKDKKHVNKESSFCCLCDEHRLVTLYAYAAHNIGVYLMYVATKLFRASWMLFFERRIISISSNLFILPAFWQAWSKGAWTRLEGMAASEAMSSHAGFVRFEVVIYRRMFVQSFFESALRLADIRSIALTTGRVVPESSLPVLSFGYQN